MIPYPFLVHVCCASLSCGGIEKLGKSGYGFLCRTFLSLQATKNPVSFLPTHDRVNQDIRFGCPDFFVRRKELDTDTHARSAFQSEVRRGSCVKLISSIPRAWIETSPSEWMGLFASTAKGVNILKQEELNGFP